MAILVLMFALLLLGAALTGIAQRALPDETQASLFVASLPALERQPLAAALVRRALASTPAHYRPSQVIAHANDAVVLWCGVPGIVLALACCLAALREAETHTLFTPTEVIRTPFLPWSPRGPRLYAGAAHAELGCNHVTGRNAGDYVIYEIHFPDGVSFDLDDAKPVGGEWIDHAERIDAELRLANVPFHALELAEARPTSSGVHRRTGV